MIPKFRAWNIESKEMLEHNFIVETVMWGGDIVRDFSDVINGEDVFILMQSTGLTDKNGKEIFEGDIVRAEHDNFSMDEVPPEYKPYIGFIKYVKTGYSIITKDTYHPCLSNIRITNIKVLGNIHEHSHLLEK